MYIISYNIIIICLTSYDGNYGFASKNAGESNYWQVTFHATVAIMEVVIYNRVDDSPGRIEGVKVNYPIFKCIYFMI